MLANVTPRALAQTVTSEDSRYLLLDMTLGLTSAKAAECRKLFQIRRIEGELTLLKLVIFVLRQFVDSTKASTKLDGVEIIEVAEGICQTYTHDSLEDLMIALREARQGDTNLYNKLSQGDIWQALKKYFERKAKLLENEHLDQKSRASSLEYSAIAQLGQLAPKLCQQMELRIDATHPNAESLRRKLSLTDAKEKRGLMTPAEAAQSRADVAAGNLRKHRADWQPSVEAQQRMEARNRKEDKGYR